MQINRRVVDDVPTGIPSLPDEIGELLEIGAHGCVLEFDGFCFTAIDRQVLTVVDIRL